MSAAHASRLAAATAVLGAPAVLAFASGGYFATPRLIAALVLWALVALLALTGPAPLPRVRDGWLVAGGLAGLAVWSAVSLAWAPLGGTAIAAVERLVLYLGALLAALGAFRDARLRRAVEPALAAGATVVIGYGLAGRLLPDLVELTRSRSAGGRLEQPITYWNAEGNLAAVGLLLCARLAGDRSRPPWLRTAAAAALVPLGAGVYLSFSRGALAVSVLGLVTLVALSGSRAQLRAAGLALAAGVLGAVATAPFPGVSSLEGAHRARDGAVALVLLTVLSATAALVADRSGAPDAELSWARRLGRVTAVLVTAVAVGLVVGGLGERPSAAELSRGAQASRLTTVTSNRYEYWRIGLAAFADHPVGGLGAGGYRVRWLQERSIAEAVHDVHSLELEQATELGLVGVALFAALLTGAVLAGRHALRRDAAAAAGPCAVALAWLVHASIDWFWQLPAVTLPAVALTALLIVLAEP